MRGRPWGLFLGSRQQDDVRRMPKPLSVEPPFLCATGISRARACAGVTFTLASASTPGMTPVPDSHTILIELVPASLSSTASKMLVIKLKFLREALLDTLVLFTMSPILHDARSRVPKQISFMWVVSSILPHAAVILIVGR